MAALALKTLRENNFSGQRNWERGCWKLEHAGKISGRRELRGDSVIVSMNSQRSYLTRELYMHRTDPKKYSKDLEN